MSNDKRNGYQNFRQTRQYGVPTNFTPPFYQPAIEVKGVPGSYSPPLPPPIFNQPQVGVSDMGQVITQVNEESGFGEPNHIPFTVGTETLLILPASHSRRVFLMIINADAALILYVQFGTEATVRTGIPLLAPSGALFFDSFVPQNDVYVVASGAGALGTIVYATKNL